MTLPVENKAIIAELYPSIIITCTEKKGSKSEINELEKVGLTVNASMDADDAS